MISRKELQELYVDQGLSMKEIAFKLECSQNKVVYWMEKYNLPRRSISEAIYKKANPNGDPFIVRQAITLEDAYIMGMGIGLYWGEGTKASKYSVRLGNSDPELLKTFMKFLMRMFAVDKNQLKFGLQVFSDIKPNKALDYWVKKLDVEPSQFYKIHVTISGSIGTYRKKNKYGVVTLYYNNKKLRDIIFNKLPR